MVLSGNIPVDLGSPCRQVTRIKMCTVTVFFAVNLILIRITLFNQINAALLDLSHGENIKIVYPRLIERTVRKRRHIERNIYYEENENLKIIEIADFSLQLNSESEGNFLVAPGMKTEWIGFDGAKNMREPMKCDYHSGVVRGLESTSKAAGGISHFLQPLEEASGAHIIYNRMSNNRIETDVKNGKNENHLIPRKRIKIAGCGLHF
ncbi:hypothetical protein NQ315_014024 [Exocentrus adspersus]|uniref:Uncharacterized protein n=1 Tax=Exocentrus adspersus TaxID=1586481 RepID=A0AAV8VBL4_9CUCU|nr:hypothetical protein NQ315_014024 [Exocentrus adspersus]